MVPRRGVGLHTRLKGGVRCAAAASKFEWARAEARGWRVCEERWGGREGGHTRFEEEEWPAAGGGAAARQWHSVPRRGVAFSVCFGGQEPVAPLSVAAAFAGGIQLTSATSEQSAGEAPPRRWVRKGRRPRRRRQRPGSFSRGIQLLSASPIARTLLVTPSHLTPPNVRQEPPSRF